METKKAVESYMIDCKKLQELFRNDLFRDVLESHTTLNTKVQWPKKRFRVVIDESDKMNDTSSLKYYKRKSETPFLQMGFSDTGYYLVCAFFRAIGERVE